MAKSKDNIILNRNIHKADVILYNYFYIQHLSILTGFLEYTFIIFLLFGLGNLSKIPIMKYFFIVHFVLKKKKNSNWEQHLKSQEYSTRNIFEHLNPFFLNMSETIIS